MRQSVILCWVVSTTVVLLLAGNFIEVTDGVSLDRDLTVTAAQKQILDKFKEEMSPLLTQDYMKTDIFLIRWLRAKDFDLEAAKTMLKKTLQWRKENKIDTILSEDFGDFGKEYSHVFEGHDKEGRPIYITNLGEWDVRKAATSGQMDRLRRIIYHGYETVSKKVRTSQAEGKLVTQYYHIYNLEGFNLVEHGCAQCVALVVDAIRTHDNHYPGFAHKIVLLNTPRLFIPLLETFKAAAGPELRETFEVFGTNRKIWEAKLLKDIDEDQLVAELGGTLLYNYQQEQD